MQKIIDSQIETIKSIVRMAMEEDDTLNAVVDLSGCLGMLHTIEKIDSKNKDKYRGLKDMIRYLLRESKELLREELE